MCPLTAQPLFFVGYAQGVMWSRLGVCVCLVVLGLVGWGCVEKEKAVPQPANKPAGATCRVASECQAGLACADRACVPAPRQANESCGLHALCAEGLVCNPSAITDRKTYSDEDYGPSDSYGDRCLTPEGLAAQKLQQERALLEKSGLSDEEVAAKMTVVEAPAAATGPGLAVRVVRTESTIRGDRETVFAACRDTERLISGSCGLIQGDNSIRSRMDNPDIGVTGHSASDTVGARWTCVGVRGNTVIAKALCQVLPEAK